MSKSELNLKCLWARSSDGQLTLESKSLDFTCCRKEQRRSFLDSWSSHPVKWTHLETLNQPPHSPISIQSVKCATSKGLLSESRSCPPQHRALGMRRLGIRSSRRALSVTETLSATASFSSLRLKHGWRARSGNRCPLFSIHRKVLWSWCYQYVSRVPISFDVADDSRSQMRWMKDSGTSGCRC